MPHRIALSEGVPSVKIYRDALKELLQRAWEVKPNGEIEPALARTELGDELDVFENIEIDGVSLGVQARSAAIETALREIFYQTLATTSIKDKSFGEIWNLLDICLILSDNELCETGLCFWLVEELLESQIISGCRRVFDYLESRREAMVAKHYRTKSLVILRACNELLKRLSRQEDTVFCGRVFIYLFQSLAFGDKSAVNLRGEFHIDNVTAYDHTSGEEATSQMEIDQPEAQTLLKDSDVNDQAVITVTPPTQGSVAVAAVSGGQETKGAKKGEEQSPVLETNKLYPVFWSLQDYFSRPTKLFEAANLDAFKSGLEATLAKFKSVHKDLEPRAGPAEGEENKGTLKRKWEEEEDDENIHSTISPKYLTSKDLFELEICDLAFRRHVLVQGLILLDFLLSQTPKAKKKLESLKNKSVIYSFTLDEKEAQWAVYMRSQIASYLQQGTEGKLYYRMVDTVLSRDKNWAYWKAEGCPNISRPSITASEYLEARNGAQRAAANKKLRANPMGALDLSFLCDSTNGREDGLEKLKIGSRYAIPAMDAYRSAILEDEFDLEMAKTDEEKSLAFNARASKLWRTLRIAAKSKFGVFHNLEDGNKLDALFDPPPSPSKDKEETAAATAAKEIVDQEAAAIINPKTTGGDAAVAPSSSQDNDNNGNGAAGFGTNVEDDNKKDVGNSYGSADEHQSHDIPASEEQQEKKQEAHSGSQSHGEASTATTTTLQIEEAMTAKDPSTGTEGEPTAMAVDEQAVT